MSQRSIAKSARSSNLIKKELIGRVVKDKNSIIWPKEMSILNKLFSIFPNELFWRSLKLSFKVNSCCWFLSDDGRKFLNCEYKKFNFDLPSASCFNILEESGAYIAADWVKPKRTLKDILNLW